MSQTATFSRAEDQRLRWLRAKAESQSGAADDGGVAAAQPDECCCLTGDEAAELSGLERKHQAFLAEGERALREALVAKLDRRKAAAPATKDPLSAGEAHASIVDSTATNVGGALHKFGRGALFWGSLLKTAVPGYVGRKIGVTPNFKHWNWVTDQLILGALPVKTRVGDSGDHLSLLGEQCGQRGTKVGLVVSCLTQDELDGFGVGVVNFVQHADWRERLPVPRFVILPIADMGCKGADYASVRGALQQMLRTLRSHTDADIVAKHDGKTPPKEAVYVHCKAGKGRSWMVLMCFLCCHSGMDFATAEALVRGQRYQVSPSASQVQFVKEFTAKFRADAEAREPPHAAGASATSAPLVADAASPSASAARA